MRYTERDRHNCASPTIPSVRQLSPAAFRWAPAADSRSTPTCQPRSGQRGTGGLDTGISQCRPGGQSSGEEGYQPSPVGAPRVVRGDAIDYERDGLASWLMFHRFRAGLRVLLPGAGCGTITGIIGGHGSLSCHGSGFHPQLTDHSANLLLAEVSHYLQLKPVKPAPSSAISSAGTFRNAQSNSAR